MIARIQPALLHGTVTAPPSKSEAHRALICAALCDEPTSVLLRGTSENIEAPAAEPKPIILREASDIIEAPAAESKPTILRGTSDIIEAPAAESKPTILRGASDIIEAPAAESKPTILRGASDIIEPASVLLRGTSENIEAPAAESKLTILRGTSDIIEAPAAIGGEPTPIIMRGASDDIEATLRGLTALGAKITRKSDVLTVEPIRRPADGCAIYVGESGTTLRLLLPLAGALGCKARFFLRGRLPERPIAPLLDALRAGGCAVEQPAPNVIFISGKLRDGEYELPGNVSSQFISGMLIALSVLNGESRLRIVGTTESAGYIRMTLKTLADFGASVSESADGYQVCGKPRLTSPKAIRIGGDWSAAAFWLCANKLSSEIDVRGLDPESAQPDDLIDVRGLDPESAQPDYIIEEILRKMPSVFDACDNPDLVPPLTALYAALGRDLRVTHAERLRMKESDRLAALAEMIRALGGRAEASDDELHIFGEMPQDGERQQFDGISQVSEMPQIGEKTPVGGVPQGNRLPLVGGAVNPRGDHRIAMAAAIAAIRCADPVEILDAECVGKSYPDFWGEYTRLGGRVEFLSEA